MRLKDGMREDAHCATLIRGNSRGCGSGLRSTGSAFDRPRIKDINFVPAKWRKKLPGSDSSVKRSGSDP